MDWGWTQHSVALWVVQVARNQEAILAQSLRAEGRKETAWLLVSQHQHGKLPEFGVLFYSEGQSIGSFFVTLWFSPMNDGGLLSIQYGDSGRSQSRTCAFCGTHSQGSSPSNCPSLHSPSSPFRLESDLGKQLSKQKPWSVPQFLPL